MRDKIKLHSKYIVGIGSEKVRILGGILMTRRGVTGTIMGHKLSTRERYCYLGCGIFDHLSFIVPMILHGDEIIEICKHIEWGMVFWKSFGEQIIYISIRYTIFTSISRGCYILSKPTQIKKLIDHGKTKQ